MKFGAFVGVLWAVDLSCVGAHVHISPPLVGEKEMEMAINELQRNLEFDDSSFWPEQKTTWMEKTCAQAFLRCPEGTTFTERRQMLPFVRDPTGQGSEMYRGRFTHDNSREKAVTTKVIIKRDILRRRGQNLGSTTIQLSMDKTSVTIDSTTKGWTIGAHLTGGFFSLLSGKNAGLIVSPSYSDHRTKGTQVSISKSQTIPCPPLHTCWSELWSVYANISGVCRNYPSVECGFSVDPCETAGKNWKLPNSCGQVTKWRDRVCNPLEQLNGCHVITPLMEGDKPYAFEVFFSEPIHRQQTKPQISGYHAGYYHVQIGSAKYLYDPDRHGPDKYIQELSDNSGYGDWHANNVYPNLDDEVAKFRHETPQVLLDEGGCYLLDTEEWYCPETDGKEKYSSAKGRYSKPTVPEPLPQVAEYLKKLNM